MHMKNVICATKFVTFPFAAHLKMGRKRRRRRLANGSEWQAKIAERVCICMASKLAAVSEWGRQRHC